MKVLFVSTMAGTAFGGSEVLWTNMAEKLLKEGHTVYASVFDWGELPPTIKLLQDKGLVVKKRSRINYPTNIGKIKGKIISKTLSKWQMNSLLKLQPDMVFFSQGAAFDLTIPVYADFINSLKVPYFCYLSLNTEYEVLPYHQMVLQRTIFENAKSIFFVSKRNFETAKRQLCSNLVNGIIINNPLTFSDTSAVLLTETQTIKFALVARMDAMVKGHPIVLKILSEEKWKKRDWILNIFGVGPDELYVKELVDFYQLKDKVKFLGQVKDIKKDIWITNHVLFMPSQYEGCPISLYDAAICGRPSVVSDVGGNAEFVIENENGFIAEAPSVDSFGKAMERLWTNKERIAEMGENARKRALITLDLTPDLTVINYIKKGI